MCILTPLWLSIRLERIPKGNVSCPYSTFRFLPIALNELLALLEDTTTEGAAEQAVAAAMARTILRRVTLAMILSLRLLQLVHTDRQFPQALSGRGKNRIAD